MKPDERSGAVETIVRGWLPAEQSTYPLGNPRLGMWANRVRLGAALSLLGLLAFFFVPMIYSPTMFQCTNAAVLCPAPPSGLMSLSYALFHWGSTYSLASWLSFGAYNIIPVGFFALPGGNELTTVGSLFLVALPIAVVGLGLLGPEIARRTKVGRAGFTTFGVGSGVLSAAMFVSMAIGARSNGGPAPPAVALGAFLGFGGSVIVLYGIGYFDMPLEEPALLDEESDSMNSIAVGEPPENRQTPASDRSNSTP
jgi:hypothetical protein